MDRSNSRDERSNRDVGDGDRATPPKPDGISPLNPATFPRAEDDEETFARSPEFHDVPRPGRNVGRGKHRS
jgi:hypothetical protein